MASGRNRCGVRRKRWWVHDDYVESLMSISEFGHGFERVGDLAGVSGIEAKARAVDFNMALCCLDGMVADVDAVHRPGTTCCGVHAEAAGVAEHI